MENAENKSASNKDSPKAANVTNNVKMTNKEIREEYFNQLRSWLHTVNTYECNFNKFQQELFKKKYQTIPKTPNEVPRNNVRVPNSANATPEMAEPSNVGSNQFEGVPCIYIINYTEFCIN